MQRCACTSPDRDDQGTCRRDDLRYRGTHQPRTTPVDQPRGVAQPRVAPPAHIANRPWRWASSGGSSAAPGSALRPIDPSARPRPLETTSRTSTGPLAASWVAGVIMPQPPSWDQTRPQWRLFDGHAVSRRAPWYTKQAVVVADLLVAFRQVLIAGPRSSGPTRRAGNHAILTNPRE